MRLLRAGPESGHAEYYAAAVYGSIIAASLIVPFFEQHGSAETVALTLLSTMAVFFLAHVWSTVVGERIHSGSPYSVHHTMDVARAEWPLIESTFGPVIVLTLGWAGRLERQHRGAPRARHLPARAVRLGRRGRPEGLRRLGPGLLSGVVNLALGVGLISLEVSVFH